MRRRDARSVDAYRAVLERLQRVSRGEDPGNEGEPAPPPPHLKIVEEETGPAGGLPSGTQPKTSVSPHTIPLGTRNPLPATGRRPVFVDDAVTFTHEHERGGPARPVAPLAPQDATAHAGADVPPLVAAATESVGAAGGSGATAGSAASGPERETILIIDDTAADTATGSSPPTGDEPSRRPRISRSRQASAVPAGGTSSRPDGVTVFRVAIVALAVAVVALVAAVFVQRGRQPAASPHAPGAVAASGPTTTSPLTAPPATATPRPSMVPTASNTGSATYAASTATVQVSITASERCWVWLRAGSATGPVVFAAIMTPGEQQSFHGLPGLWVQLGYPPGVTMQVDGVPVPTRSGGPFDVIVQTSPKTS